MPPLQIVLVWDIEGEEKTESREVRRMPSRLPARALFVAGEDEKSWGILYDSLNSTAQIELETRRIRQLPGDLEEYQVLVLTDPAMVCAPEEERLRSFIRQGGGCLLFAGRASGTIPPLFGVSAGEEKPLTELRIHFSLPEHPIAARLPATFFLHDRFRPLSPVDGESQEILATAWQGQKVPLAILRQEGKGRVCTLGLQGLGSPLFARVIYRILRHLAGLGETGPLQVAILGYGPLGSVGWLHGLAVQEVPGLHLRAFCDVSPERLIQCGKDFPECRTYSSAEELGCDPEIDLVFVATPPNTHAELAIHLLQAGKHVVCEKPMCLTYAEAEAMIQAAEEHGAVLSCYQNRRWDPDFLAIREVVREGLIGDLFYMETFLGGYGHPCHFWHSHRPISGGAVYDWGAHYVDWILNLFAEEVVSVTGLEQKRVWQDTTNADQIRTQIRFCDGKEAEFLYSDIAALRKPKWYLLGTKGAIVGHWSEVTVHQPDPVRFYREERIPVTETPPHLTCRRVHSS
ncbi:MAG: Gfo/Idh/MocA family oxidoreductase, partial [candidate division NC10 bacterium]|nr:Gfo/Idh/MocA family oxidoreductase [candidate division NC10 bacterium]